jgi:hypothetical protein
MGGCAPRPSASVKFQPKLRPWETWSPLSFAVISNQTCYYLLLEG